MSNQTSFQRVIAFLVIGFGLITVGVAAMTLITLRQDQANREIAVEPAKANYPAPALALNDLEGNPRSLEDYRGQVVLVNLWATWCPPCREEMPTLEAFYKKYQSQGFVIVGVNDGETPEQVTPFITELELSFPIWLDPNYLTEETFKTINLPSSYVIDRRGQVRLQWVGKITRKMLDKYVVPIIEEKQ